MKTGAFAKTYNGRLVLSLPELELQEGKITEREYLQKTGGTAKTPAA